MITAENLTRKYGETVAVNAVSFTIKHGEIVGLLGHNGAGKSTIMKIITGYLEPTDGTVHVDGLDVLENRLQVQQKIGYLPENCPLYPEMDVLEFLEYAAKMKGVPEDEIPGRVRNAVNKTRLDEMAFRQVNTLSRGYRQRLGVAQAILNSAKILILDEPTNGLDPSQIFEMRSLIKELAETSTVVISTHILQEVQAVCNRVIIINRGRIGLDAPMSELRPTNRISVLLDKPVAAVAPALQSLSGVTLLESIEKPKQLFEYIIDLDPDLKDDAAPDIAKHLVQKDFRLFALQQHVRDLETIFAEISSGKEPPAPPNMVSPEEATAPALTSSSGNEANEEALQTSDSRELLAQEEPVVQTRNVIDDENGSHKMTSAPGDAQSSIEETPTLKIPTVSDSYASAPSADSDADKHKNANGSQSDSAVGSDSSDSISMKDGR